jgi:hypothetical protein
MTQDQNKKTLRHFQCRDYLWEVFEQMSAELECSTDYLINEAMRQYARSRNYGTSRNQAAPEPSPVAAPAPRAPAAPAHAPVVPSMGPIPSLRGGSAQRPSIPAPPPPPRRDSGQHAAPAPRAPAAPPAPRRPSSMPPPPPGRSAPMPPPPSHAPPPRPGANATRAAQHNAGRHAAMPSLFVIFNGQKIPIAKEEFVIGRGAKSADLAIKDGNISRRHAAIVFHNGAFFMKDLGSTNGVEFEGRRFDSKRIEEGDIFRMCDYELRFTYQ